MSDERKLEPAGRNPWYVLMTVAGEQKDEHFREIDPDLHTQNLRFWNGWMGRQGVDGLPSASHEDMVSIDKALQARCGANVSELKLDDFFLPALNFSYHLVYDGFVFPKAVFFTHARFKMRVSFRRAIILEGLYLTQATFLRSVDFSDAKIAYASFKRSRVAGYADFSRATFREKADFSDATFEKESKFNGAGFVNFAEFGRMIFSQSTDFGGAKFGQKSDFSGSKFFGRFGFTGADVSGKILFNNTEFHDFATFRNAKFSTRSFPPEFYHSRTHENTDWSAIAWPSPPSNPDIAITHRRAYERLKLLMAEQKKHADEHMFLRLELKCREVEEGRSLAGIASRAYGRLSDYGWSITRPLAGLGIVWLVCAALIFVAEWADYWLGDWPVCDTCPVSEHLGPFQSLALSFSNLFGFLGLGRVILRDELLSLTAFSEFITSFQFVAGPVLLFLLVLALRNRFRFG